MLQQLLSNYPTILSAIEQDKTPAYLVGGAVRDLLLNKITHDLDFVVVGDASRVARTIANRSGGAFFMLDDRRNTARVIIHDAQGHPTNIDFASARGGSLETDLLDRDFTINALAFDLEKGMLIDPLKGASDLKEGILRGCSEYSLLSDPLRILRGIRFSLLLQLKIHQETRKQMETASHLLQNVSGERIRDELFRILGEGKSAQALRLMQHFRVLPFILPELNPLFNPVTPSNLTRQATENVLSAIEKTDVLLDILLGTPQEKHENLMAGLVVLVLGKYRNQFRNHYAQSLNPYRPLRALILFAALFSFSRKSFSQYCQSLPQDEYLKRFIDRCKALAFSNQEILRARQILANYALCDPLFEANTQPDQLQIHRYFKKNSEAGIDICLLKLAEYWAFRGFQVEQMQWVQQMEIVSSLLHAWWNQYYEVINPDLVVNGTELCDKLSLKPSPIVGLLLEKIKEAQVTGDVTNKDEAFHLAKMIITDFNTGSFGEGEK